MVCGGWMVQFDLSGEENKQEAEGRTASTTYVLSPGTHNPPRRKKGAGILMGFSPLLYVHPIRVMHEPDQDPGPTFESPNLPPCFQERSQQE